MSYTVNLKTLSADLGVNVIADDLIPKHYVVGERYHLAWAHNRGMNWKLVQILGNQCIMETPKTKRRLTTHIKDLREVNRNIKANAKRRINKFNN